MVNDIQMTLTGSLTADPELRYTQGGIAVASFTIAQNPRNFNKSKNAWEDGEANFIRCSVWREYAEHVAATLFKGTRVIATGRFNIRRYEDKEGNKRTSPELQIDEIGPALRYATAIVEKVKSGRTPQYSAGQAAADEAWADAPASGSNAATSQAETLYDNDDTPF